MGPLHSIISIPQNEFKVPTCKNSRPNLINGTEIHLQEDHGMLNFSNIFVYKYKAMPLIKN